MKIDLEQIKDCDHCFHTFGSLGCCDTVSNEWVYSCREGQRKYWIDRVLEIIDTVNDDLVFGTRAKGVALSIKENVLALQGVRNEQSIKDNM